MKIIPVFRGGSVPVTQSPETRPEAPVDGPVTHLPAFQPGVAIKDLKPIDPQSGKIKAWAASSLKKFEDCPRQVYLSKIVKAPDPSGDAANRGTEIHQQAEDYVNGKLDAMPATLAKFATEFRELRRLFEDGAVTLEGDWGFNTDWEPCEYFGKDVWGRAKLDAFVSEDSRSARIVDFKTGKKWENEIVHASQAMIYAIVTFMRYPELQFLTTEFWYLDVGETTIQRYTREQAMELMPRLRKRALKLTTAQEFRPQPSKKSCMWCNHGKIQEGRTEPACPYAWEQ